MSLSSRTPGKVLPFLTLFWGLLALDSATAQSARLVSNSVKYTPDHAKKELTVELRLAEETAVSGAETKNGAEAVPTTWTSGSADKSLACAWMIVVDTSNANRAKTIAKCSDAVTAFVATMPKQDVVSIYTLDRDLTKVVDFTADSAKLRSGLANVKPGGDSSKTTLIYTNLNHGLTSLEQRVESRKAIVLLTDGKDETPGGPSILEAAKQKLIEAAKTASVTIHTLGYAEVAKDQVFYAALKDISAQTDGIHAAASVDTKELPSDTILTMQKVMHSGGTARIDLSKLKEAVPLTLTVKTASAGEITVAIPQEQAQATLKPTPEELEKQKKEKEEKEKAEADKKAEEERLAKEKEAQAAADKKRADEEAAKANQSIFKRYMWWWIGGGIALLAIITGIILAVAARRRAAAEEAEAFHRMEMDRLAEESRRQTALLESARQVEAPPLAWLEMCDAQQTRHPVRIPNLKIGRGQHNDLVFRNDSVSGNHCVLNCSREGEWSVTDLNSGNGVVVNDSRVAQAPLRHGDLIELGDLKMRFLIRA